MWNQFITVIITLLTNSLINFIKNRFDFRSDNQKFKREYCYKQLEELYLELYAIIAQSDYLRNFLNSKLSIKEYPFYEYHEKNIHWVNKNGLISLVEEDVEDDITEFNKTQINYLIFTNKKYASQSLIKLAVGYRICHANYLKDSLKPDLKEKYQKEELQLMFEIVTTIVKECNEKLKICNMEYSTWEMNTGIIDYSFHSFLSEDESKE